MIEEINTGNFHTRVPTQNQQGRFTERPSLRIRN